MDVHPPKNGIFIGIDPYPYLRMSLKMLGDCLISRCDPIASSGAENDIHVIFG